MTFFQRFYVAIAALLLLAIWAFSYFVIHAAEGLPRLLWVLAGVVVFGVVCWWGNRRQGR